MLAKTSSAFPLVAACVLIHAGGLNAAFRLMPREWRLLRGVEALTGIPMCRWSTEFFFAVVTRIFDSRVTSGARRSMQTHQHRAGL
jgi:hypothetical protein